MNAELEPRPPNKTWAQLFARRLTYPARRVDPRDFGMVVISVLSGSFLTLSVSNALLGNGEAAAVYMVISAIIVFYIGINVHRPGLDTSFEEWMKGITPLQKKLDRLSLMTEANTSSSIDLLKRLGESIDQDKDAAVMYKTEITRLTTEIDILKSHLHAIERTLVQESRSIHKLTE